MISPKNYQLPSSFSIYRANPLHISLLRPHFLALPLSPTPQGSKSPLNVKPLSFSNCPYSSSLTLSVPTSHLLRVSEIGAPICSGEDRDNEIATELQDLSPNSPVYKKTLQLVECSMFAALTGLVYFLSNSLAIEVCKCVLNNGISSISQLRRST